MSLQSKALRGYRFPPQAHDQALHNGLHCKVTKKFLAAQIINAYLCKHKVRTNFVISHTFYGRTFINRWQFLLVWYYYGIFVSL